MRNLLPFVIIRESRGQIVEKPCQAVKNQESRQCRIVEKPCQAVKNQEMGSEEAIFYRSLFILYKALSQQTVDF